MKIKAIDTYYKGYKFRSRLEARWAVYFDSIGLEWEYEKEGYEFDDGTKYLPDFWLPEVKMWAEVKPIKLNEKEEKKIFNLVNHTGYPVLELIGVPEIKTYNCWKIYKGTAWNCDEVLLSIAYNKFFKNERRFYSMPGEPEETWEFNFPDISRAVNKARSARFEFGENGE